MCSFLLKNFCYRNFSCFLFSFSFLKAKHANMMKINPLIEFQPCREALAVLILQSKVPDLSESNRFHNLQEDKGSDLIDCSMFIVLHLMTFV